MTKNERSSDDLAGGALAERVAAYAEARDRQARSIAAAACAHVSAMGACENLPEDHDPEYDGHYCDTGDTDKCTYCALARAMEGYDDQG